MKIYKIRRIYKEVISLQQVEKEKEGAVLAIRETPDPFNPDDRRYNARAIKSIEEAQEGEKNYCS